MKTLPHRLMALRCRRKFHLDAHIAPDAPLPGADFSPAIFCRDVLDTGTDSVCVFAKCHYGYSYYPTDIGHPHPRMCGDLMGGLVNEFKKMRPELPVLAYFNLRYSGLDLAEHPDWAMQGPAEHMTPPAEPHIKVPRASDDLMWRYMCFNGPYGDKVRRELLEIIQKYPVDGFFMDFSRSQGLCFCRHCLAKFHQATGTAPPSSCDNPVGWNVFCDWSRQASDKFLVELTESLQAVRPEITLSSNYCYGIRQPLKVPDAIGYLAEDVRERGQMRGFCESLDGRYYVSVPVPAEIMTTRMVHWWGDWDAKTPDELFLQNAVISALGLNVDLSDELYPNYKIPARVSSLFRRQFELVERVQTLMQGASSSPDVLVLHSAATYYADHRAVNDDPARLKPIEGVHSALVQSNFHYQFVNEAYLLRWIDKAPLLILPEQSVLDGDTVRLILDYAAGGGVVLGIGATLANPGLSELFGARAVQSLEYPWSFVSHWPADGCLPDGDISDDCPVPVHGHAWRVELSGAEVLMLLREGCFSGIDRPFTHGQPIGACRWPAVTRHEYGEGMGVGVSCPVDISLTERFSPELRRWLLTLLGMVHPSPFMTWKSSDTVEWTRFTRGATEIIHLIRHPARVQADSAYVIDRIEPLAEFEISVKVAKPPGNIHAADPEVKVEWRMEGTDLIVKVAPLPIHVVLIMEVGA